MISAIGRRLLKHVTAPSIFWAIIVGVLPGCTSAQDRNSNLSRYYDDLSKSTTPQQREHILSVLASHPHRDEAICGLIKGWGTLTGDYDLAVLDFLRLHEADAAITACFMDRLREDPSLIRQVFWNHRWESEKRQRIVSPNAEPDNSSPPFIS